MDLGPLVKRRVVRYRPGRWVPLFALFLMALSGFSPRADAEFAGERASGLTSEASRTQSFQWPTLERLDTHSDQVLDPFEDDDWGSEPRLGPALQSSETVATFPYQGASLDSQPFVSANTARGPPSA